MVNKLVLASTLLMLTALPAVGSVVVNSPSSGSDIESPFTLSASAATCSSQKVSAMGYSFDSGSDTIAGEDTLETSVDSASGSHTLHIKAWGEHGSVCVEDVKVNVKTGTSGGGGGGSTEVPSYAKTVGDLQSMGNWRAAHDTGGSGKASGSTKLVSSPSKNGITRQFATKFSSSGDERFSLNFGDDVNATHFFYDAWVYFPKSATSVANLEMDMNQTISNGYTITFGMQCSSYDGKWDFTVNEGSPKKPHDHWKSSGAKCNPESWSKNTWHHIQASYSRSGNNVTYHSVWVDGKESTINATGMSAFALGWGRDLITNFQVDGHGKSGSDVVYLDSLQISRWE
jgi:hypothetical protein